MRKDQEARSKGDIRPACNTGHLRVRAWRGGMRWPRRVSGLTINGGFGSLMTGSSAPAGRSTLRSVVQSALADVDHRLPVAEHPAGYHPADDQVVVARRVAGRHPA